MTLTTMKYSGGKLGLLVILVLSVFWCTDLSGVAQDVFKPGNKQSQIRDPRREPGNLISQGENTTPVGPYKLLTYKLEDVDLSEPVTLHVRGRNEVVRSALRLTITSQSGTDMQRIWIDDAALTKVWERGSHAVATLIFDRSILRDGAVVSVEINRKMFELPDRLKLPANFTALIKPYPLRYEISRIQSTLRPNDSSGRLWVEIEMKATNLFKARNERLMVQIGKRTFEAGGDENVMRVFLTPAEFAQLHDGEEVIAFYGSPERCCGTVLDVWEFGRLDKSLIYR